MSSGARKDRVALAFVLLVWLALSVRATLWLGTVASPIPVRDDLIFVLPLDPDHKGSLTEIWQPINEHRVPLARAIMTGLLHLVRDIRTGMFAQIGVLSLCALGAILLARRLRGRTSPFDALFPLLFLHFGYTESWLLALQLTVALPTAIVLVLVALTVRSPGPPSAATLAGVSACALLLVTCGGFGWSQMPVWAAWLGFCAWRARSRGDLRAARIGAFGLALVSAVSLLYAIGLPYRVQEHGAEAGRAIAIAVQFLSSFAGPAAAQAHVAYVVLASVLACVTVAGLLHVARTRPDERERAGALLAGTLGVIAIACAVGISRQGDWPVAGWAARYLGAQAPLVVCAVLAAVLYAPRALALGTQAVLAIALVCAQPAEDEAGRAAGDERALLTREMYAEVAKGVSVGELSQRFWRRCFIHPNGYKYMLGLQLKLRLPPFDRELAADPTRLDRDPLETFARRAERWTGPRAPRARHLDGVDGIALQADATLVFARAPADQRLNARFAVLPWCWAEETVPEQRTHGVLFRVTLAHHGKEPRVLWERRLDPERVEEDRGLQSLELELPDSDGGEIVLSVLAGSQERSTSDWGMWGAVTFR